MPPDTMLCPTVEGVMRRREFIFLVSGAATMWSMRARAQQSERIRLIGVLQGVPADDQQGKVRFNKKVAISSSQPVE